MADTPTLASARALVDGALVKAEAIGIHVSIAVLDAGGYLVAFQRMDGAPPFTADVAQGKAYGVIFMRRTSAELRDMANTRPQFFDAVKSLGRRTLIPSPGGVPIPGGGAIGISGAADPNQDVDVAEAAIAGLNS
ncbi:MAG: heme-binding protein [Chloroflexota bacterium]|nr:heme-binding protein [Chloroflexota bacterium]